jgi:hypothetical protein
MDASTTRAVKAALRHIRFSRDGDLEVEVGGSEEPSGVEVEVSDEDIPEAEAEADGDEYSEEDSDEIELPAALRRARRER